MKTDDLHKAFLEIAKMSIDLRHIHHEIFDIIPHSTSQVMHATAELLDAIEEGVHALYDITQRPDYKED